ncbi:unnamed protein product [Fraxinus pennsylvanica]|uniref:Peptidase A1 domain-containing protein n=1 Tax=Fraxinus pennsylvanica TaxID=56036 RepID=A0AAD2A0D3_9LAMI|nr:unnamed protein product [Fraxinus pennsylvanica]
MGSKRAKVNAVIDLGERFLLFNCDSYTSSTYAPIHCDSKKCEIAKGFGCEGCYGPLGPGAPTTPVVTPLQSIPGYYCILRRIRRGHIGLASGTTGILGLATIQISLHKEGATKLSLPDMFSLCFPSSGIGKILLESMENLSLKSSYFTIGRDGIGGTKISTVKNFTTLHSSIYKALTIAFVKAASYMKIKSVNAVAPFRACFSSATISAMSTGPSVPIIELVLPGNDVSWKINGANSTFAVNKNVLCLAFVDGGSNPRTSIVIGAHQMEDNLLEFDLNSSQLRFSSSLLVQNKTCSLL